MLSRILIATTLLLSSFAHAEKGDIVIGQIINFSGDQADTCRDYLTGAQVLFDAVNIKGGIHGRRISLSQRFEGNSPAANQKLAEDLVNREGAIALFGLCGGPAARQLVESGWIKSGSSRDTGKRVFDLQEEVAVIPVAVGHAFDYLDAIIDSLQQAGIQVMGGAGDDAVHVRL